MPYGQAKGIIDAGRAFHQRASTFYQQLHDKAEGARVKMLLDYLVRHEALSSTSQYFLPATS